MGKKKHHLENTYFKQDYQTVGIAYGPHKNKFQMCVMDFAFDFQPLNASLESNVFKNKMN